MLEHVDEEELLLAELVDRRGDRHEGEEQAEREEPAAPGGDRLPARRERRGAAVVEERRRRDQQQLSRVPRPARQRGRHAAQLRLAVVASYEAAGVSLTTAGAVVERLRAAVESTGAYGFGAFAGLYPLGDDRFLRRVAGLDRDEADGRSRTWRAAGMRRGHGRALHQRRCDDWRFSAVHARLRGREPARPRAGRGACRGRGGGLPGCRVRAGRRRDGGDAGRVPRGRARLRRVLRRAGRARAN